MNQFLTVLGFLHLAFQPFFANLYMGSFMTRGQKRYLPLILSLSLMGGVMLTNRLFQSERSDVPCEVGIEPMCGARTCTFHGNVHLAW